MRTRVHPSDLVGLALFLGAASARAQTFQDDPSRVPQGTAYNSSDSENVDFGDVDADGDFDAVFACGGWYDQQQERIWINLGGAQGGAEGYFRDETGMRFPAVNDQSRDVEFADIDGDGDLDLYVSNTSDFVAQSNRWLINSGIQSGFFEDQTAIRWIGLGEAGSSISPALVLPKGGFIDYSHDCDFVDFDADGDLDLLHTSHGHLLGGGTPSRIFLNNGLGFFREFNPSGYQLPGETIGNGAPGIWCEGVQQHETDDSSGTYCDIASVVIGVEVGDTDGDFDLDILLGSRDGDPRMFQNRLAESGGLLRFRDVTSAVFPPGYAYYSGHYEQELGDLDSDGDLDVYGVNWHGATGGGPYTDVVLRNLGGGVFGETTDVPYSWNHDEEADFFDYEGDGDLDVVVPGWDVGDRLYRNDTIAGGPIVLTDVTDAEMPHLPFHSADVEACDVDGDGDYDLLEANIFDERDALFVNVGSGLDVHAPRVTVEDLPDHAADLNPTVVRASVLDNAPYYLTWYASVALFYSVDGGSLQSTRMSSSGGQIFRGEIPGQIHGLVDYYVVAADRYGNRATSGTASYIGRPGAETGLVFCTGDGSGTPCPCENTGHAAKGCGNSANHGGGQLLATGTTSLAAGDLELVASGMVPGEPALFFQGDQFVAGGAGELFGGGLRCAGGIVRRLETATASSSGTASSSVNIGLTGGASPGDVLAYQLWYRDPGGSCGSNFNLSNGLCIDWQP